MPGWDDANATGAAGHASLYHSFDIGEGARGVAIDPDPYIY
jgi:hypothetical protein